MTNSGRSVFSYSTCDLLPHCLFRDACSTPPSCDCDSFVLTEYMALTIRVAVEALVASSSGLWASLLTVSTLMSGLPRVTPRRPGRKKNKNAH